MDHHDDWTQWHPDDGDTADLGPDVNEHDLGGPDFGEHDFGDHDLGADDLGADDLGADDLAGYGDHDLTPGPDLVHEGTDLDAHEPDLTGPDTDPPHEQPLDDQPIEDQPAGTEHLVGTDPDLPADPHSGWHEGYFPPALDLDTRPEPADGYPWADPDVLGSAGDAADAAEPTGPATGGAAAAGDLFAYAGIEPAPPGADPWGQLLASDDPATSSLARFWGPG